MLENLILKIEQYNPQANTKQVIKAYSFAEAAHEGQYRNSGERFFVHPYNVAMILIELNMDTDTIVAGLLHDVLEDTDVVYEKLVEEFGEEVANLVEGVTKLKKLKYKTKQENQAENLRKMVVAMAKDIRVIIIKLADRLHNMRTLEYMSEEKKKEKALETLEIYAPLAHRLGISKIKWELEDLSLRFLDPEGYYKLVDKVSKQRREREAYIQMIINTLQEKLDEMEVSCEISGRPKNFYSIYRKMVYQNKSFEQIFDLTAIRIIVDTLKDCYGALGIVHTMWKPIPGRFKDYIAMPKPNMYQSLHTTVIGPQGEPFEVQIRTWDMHRTAEYGIAAHWKYKEGTVKTDNFDEKLSWLRQLLEWQKDMKDPKEFMESLKIDFFTDEVFVFTPKGDVISLPNGSTPIDFAYRVHTAVGNNCVGAKVDGRIVPLDYKLKNGNIVEVITSANSTGPSRDWLKVVKSSQAKTKIRQWFKREEKDLNIIKGKDMLEKDVKRQGFKLTEILKEDWLKNIASKLSLNNTDDLYAGLGYGSVTLSQVMPRLKEFYKERHDIKEEKNILEPKITPQISKKKERVQQGVTIKGVDNIKVRFSKCCNPVPGDDIVGYITRGRGVSIHRSDCPNIEDLGSGERFIYVEWADDEKASYQAEIQIKATDRSGLLTDITQRITEAKLAVLSLSARTNREKLVVMNITLEIKDINQLRQLMKKIKKVKGVIDVYRVTT
ncbi:bifunctional (p)ppGpp synthetase/guanosine-3',5'-bis(diphosphate) 3'-pyrophosphohydrolase [Anaerosalibacter bizertensis]|uniref:GTP diphosphokinase n=1 Tax=Anaerosalibacter bizertensis TaxID=932217 RepID=A0A9Q4FKP2_9FIRM|nr:bifunctional (p)ppGpp synthetase/guanosine-3',5'-bis(diphosphate) 3'-pyrophosphohydrolase [Anaerosalibacter bizertensis]MCB5559250.1 bifunctional (p)ppGpp synthetase/guanosine-3',5'-bis(diphosphate) 3'-pyrophosphohydrolase [Anaerosalibacter bizertensis]MCG4564038.1 bifunctional (p)ppGpp synthetase/guanosine-3',5'-bis(diphosphate) 3'-pyrophosphohydrolase [Anaerosalibacter bizertensis]MCG4581818.1 bifunctional (p)ppGpp synthetase/guanosine-3',5'-bis(diphosphate) 3'-pyrophosphohydrolase [Anaeros